MTDFNLDQIKKSVLVNMTKELTGSTGDYARLGKGHYIDTLSSYSDEQLTAAYAKVSGVPTISITTPSAAPAAPALDDQAVTQLLGALSHLIKPSMDEDQIRKVVADEIKNSDRPSRTIVVKDAKKVEIDEHTHPEFQDVLLYSGLKQSTMLVGPAGTGKTHLAHQVSTALDLPFASISCTVGMSESSLTGRLIPTGDNGKFEYVESDFVRLYENGGVFLFDEIDAADANVMMIVNQALANGGFFISHRTGNTYVKRHPDFVCIAAANTFGHGADMIYAGRERLDAATLDRFEQVAIDYDDTLEEKLADPEVLEFARHTRKRIASNRIRRVMSTRRIIAMTQQKEAGMPFAKIKDRYFASWTADERAMAA